MLRSSIFQPTFEHLWIINSDAFDSMPFWLLLDRNVTVLVNGTV